MCRPDSEDDNLHYFRKDTSLRLSSNEALEGSSVCFCDIPLSDLQLHISKYTQFGIAFSKEFLIEHGASPVIYVPRDGRPGLLPYEGYGRGRVSSQGAAFDHFWQLFNKVEATLPAEDTASGRTGGAGNLRRLLEFLELHIISNLKFFDQHLADDDRDNFYMEREWRIPRNLRFSLNEVQRIFVPARLGRRLREEFPEFEGEVFFADMPH